MNQQLLAQLEEVGLNYLRNLHHNLSTPQLYEQIVQRREGQIAHLGSLIVRTGKHTGRSASDKFVVKYPHNEDEIFWSKDTQATDSETFKKLHTKISAFMQSREIFIQDCFAGADPENRLRVRVITQYAWHSLFARNMFINNKQVEEKANTDFEPDFTIIDAPEFFADPEEDNTNSETFIMLDFDRKLILIGGTAYAGEIKKSIFTVMNYILPKKGIMSMHCSANIGDNGETALFFGLSGTGKTTLSADPSRKLIGDDEHGWSDNGIFNVEGGCYAKVINITRESEPDIYECTRKFGTVMENVVYDEYSRRVDFTDISLTENTRACYPIQHIENIAEGSQGGHPKHIIFLTYDAYGVLPPVSKLNTNQAMYQFLSGYTAKVGGTEKGLKGVKTTFSFAFGAPFMPHKPMVYAELLAKKIEQHGTKVWLINTGYKGGSYGSEEGERFSLKHTRRIVHAILDNELEKADFRKDEVFGFGIPTSIEGVPNDILNPRELWKDKNAYDNTIQELAGKFDQNFQQFVDKVSEEVKSGGPNVGTSV